MDSPLDSLKRKSHKCSFCNKESSASLQMIINGSVVRSRFCDDHMVNYSFSNSYESLAKKEKLEKDGGDKQIILALKKAELSYLKGKVKEE